MNYTQRLIELVFERTDLTVETNTDEICRILDEIILSNKEFKEFSYKEKIHLRRSALNRLNGYDVLSELLEDEEISEIMVNGYENIFVEKRGKLKKLDKKFQSEERLFDVIQKIMSKTNRVVNETNPIVDTRLSDGSRVNIVLPPISLSGGIITIRRFPKEVMTLDRLVTYKSINEEIKVFLEKIVKEKFNIFISGATSSGKTSMLNALTRCIPKDERIITIEDSAEIKIEGIENYISLEVRNVNVEGKNEVSMRDLIKTALRMRPDRIIVGEVRGPEAIEMIQAMNTGHDGSISTGHANSAKDMISRLETMVIMGIDIPLDAIRRQILSAIDILIHLGRNSKGERVVEHICQIVEDKDGEILLNDLFRQNGNGFIKINEII